MRGRRREKERRGEEREKERGRREEFEREWDHCV